MPLAKLAYTPKYFNHCFKIIIYWFSIIYVLTNASPRVDVSSPSPQKCHILIPLKVGNL